MSFRMARTTGLCLALLTLCAAPSMAQVYTGRIDASVTDSTGAVLPGVNVDISGPQIASAVTDTAGEAHFLNLAPGIYTVSAKITGFSDYLNKSINVGAGASVPLKIAMAIAGVSTQVQVTAESPILDTKKMTTSTNVTVDELQNIPSSRDPWVVLQTVPGIMVDRVNVGGAESGQQSAYQAKGAAGSENTWNIDGVAVTDMAALGSTPTYYDFDMFQEMQVTTGGADVQSPTPGVQLNMVLKSGTNTPHGSSRIYFENEDLQANNMPSDLAASIGGTGGKGNRTHQYKDYGVELGGPIVKDRLWAWGSIAKTHVDILTLTSAHDRTELQDTSFKGTGQITNGIRANYTYFRGNKEKFGRGASPTRPDETTYNQSGPTTLNKGEVNFVLGNNLFLAARGSHVHGGFSLAARGGPDKQIYIDDGGVWHGSADTYITERPQDSVTLDGNTFHGHHELKFGFGWRKASVDSSDVYPGNGLITNWNGYPEMIAKITRPNRLQTDAKYLSAYGGDTWTRDRMTVNLGLRWDRVANSAGSASVPASSVLPDLLPALSATPVDNAIVMNTVTPRVGFTYALAESRKTIVRASYAIFASQLNATAASVISPIQYSAIYYYAVDTNGNKIADPNEVQYNLGNIGYYGFDPNPTRLDTINKIGDYAAPRTQEVMFGMDHELMQNFGISGTVTYRYFNHFNWNSLIGVNSSNYHQTGTFTGNVDPIGQFSVPFYAIDPAVVPPGGGTSYEERKGYHQKYLGFEVSATKRLSNKWMGRFGFATNSHKEYFDGADALDDPTHTPNNPRIDGGHVVTQTGGSGKSNIYLVLPEYQFIANGLYQGPWGLNLGANWLYRQGYAMPYFRSNVATTDVLSNNKSVLAVSDVTDFRLPAVSSLDARVEKAIKIQRANIMLDLDVFNIFNNSTVLGRQYDIRRTGATGFNKVLEIMNPRILRLGARINF
jgi:Carboxypeptidase regulatory-like domain/TonB-dependent Receptor Plug Domain